MGLARRSLKPLVAEQEAQILPVTINAPLIFSYFLNIKEPTGTISSGTSGVWTTEGDCEQLLCRGLWMFASGVQNSKIWY